MHQHVKPALHGVVGGGRADSSAFGGNRGQCAFPFIFVLRDFVWSD